MDRRELEELKLLHERRLRELQAIKVHCPSCMYLSARGMCDRWGAQVPVEVQPVGCDTWKYDFVPF